MCNGLLRWKKKKNCWRKLGFVYAHRVTLKQQTALRIIYKVLVLCQWTGRRWNGKNAHRLARFLWTQLPIRLGTLFKIGSLCLFRQGKFQFKNRSTEGLSWSFACCSAGTSSVGLCWEHTVKENVLPELARFFFVVGCNLHQGLSHLVHQIFNIFLENHRYGVTHSESRSSRSEI